MQAEDRKHKPPTIRGVSKASDLVTWVGSQDTDATDDPHRSTGLSTAPSGPVGVGTRGLTTIGACQAVSERSIARCSVRGLTECARRLAHRRISSGSCSGPTHRLRRSTPCPSLSRGWGGRVLLKEGPNDFADVPALSSRSLLGPIMELCRDADRDAGRVLADGRAERRTPAAWLPGRQIEAIIGLRRQPIQIRIGQGPPALRVHRHSITLA